MAPVLKFHGVSCNSPMEEPSHRQTEVPLCELPLSCHFHLSLFALKVKNFHRPTGCIHMTKDIDKIEFHGQTGVALCELRLSCHFYLSLFGLKVKNFHRPTGCIHMTKDIDKMARMGDIASAASD